MTGAVNTPDMDRPAETNKVGEYPPHTYDETTQQWVPVGGATQKATENTRKGR